MYKRKNLNNLDIKAKMQTLFISGADLAEAVGISISTMFRWLGSENLSQVRRQRISDGMDRIIKQRSGGGQA